MTYTVTAARFRASGLDQMDVLSNVARLHLSLRIRPEYMRDCPERDQLASMAAGLCAAGGIGDIVITEDAGDSVE